MTDKVTDESVDAWRGFCERLSALGERILADDFPSSPFDRAEGVRHLATQLVGWLGWEAGFSEPHFPMFMRQNDLVMKWGGPNSDQTSIRTSVVPEGRYRIAGNMHSCEDFIISVKNGDMHDGVFGILAETTASDMGIEPGDDFVIDVGGERTGDRWLPLPSGTEHLNIRQYYFDWTTDEPAVITIERVDTRGLPAPPLTPRRTAEILDNAARRLENSVVYWNEYMRDSLRDVGMNQIAAPRQVAGGADNIFYSDGFFDLAPDQALVIECDVPDARYWDFQLYNMAWFETLDFANRTTSLNHHQVRVDGDGRMRIVVAQRDPGVPNWLDTAGHRNGMIIFRCIKSQGRPTPSAALVELSGVSKHVAADTPAVTPTSAAARSGSVRRTSSTGSGCEACRPGTATLPDS